MAAEVSDFQAFVRDLREVTGLHKAQPEDSTVERCAFCSNKFTVDDRKPMRLRCCGDTSICSDCVSRWSESQRELMKDDNIYSFTGTTCPFCRCGLTADENETLLKELRQKLRSAELAQIEEAEEMKCVKCGLISRKPHHRVVCVTCRDDVGDWLLSDDKKDRSKIKESTYCYKCSYWHTRQMLMDGHDKCELRLVTQLIGYTKGLAEAASDALLKRMKNEGYLPRSLSILYSLAKDGIEHGKQLDRLTIECFTEVLRETKQSMLSKEEVCDRRKVAIADFSVFFRRLVDDIHGWSEVIATFAGNPVKDADWAHSAAELVATSIGFACALLPDVLEDWDILNELLLKFLPTIAKKLDENDGNRLRTMWLLYRSCQLIDQAGSQKQ